MDWCWTRCKAGKILNKWKCWIEKNQTRISIRKTTNMQYFEHDFMEITLYWHNCTFIRILSFCLISNNIWCNLDWNWCFKTIFPARSAHFWMMDICWVWNMFKMSLCFTISWPGGHFCKTSKAVEKGSEWWPRKSNCKCKDKLDQVHLACRTLEGPSTCDQKPFPWNRKPFN